MQAILNENGFEEVSPLGVGEYFESDADDYNYSRIFKAMVHIYLIPLLGVLVFGPKFALIYLGCMVLLYSTVFRAKSKEFFSILLASIAFCCLMILS